MSLSLKSCLWLCLLSFLTSGLFAQNNLKRQKLILRINEIVAPYLEAADFQGVIGIQKGDDNPLILPYGYASVELDVPHRGNNTFMIGSVSKQFTGVAILLLEEDGKLKTSDTIEKYLPDFPRGKEITIEQLLTHTSGVADVYSLKSFGKTAGLTARFDDVISELAAMELTFDPGNGYAYSNGGYSLLGAIIEKVSGRSYGEFLHERIFKPLEMNQTAHDARGEAVKKRVPGYDPIGFTELAPVQTIHPDFTLGNGSLWSSASNLLKWNKALHNGRVLSKASYRKLITDYGRGYGYGVSVFRRFDTSVIGHDGRVAGYASDLAYYPDKKVSVVILSNVQSVARDDIRRLVAAAALGERYERPTPKVFAADTDRDQELLTGAYSFGPNFTVYITSRDGRLWAQANEGGLSEIVPLENGRWFSRMLYATVQFGEDGSGAVDRLIWGEGSNAPVGRKLISQTD